MVKIFQNFFASVFMYVNINSITIHFPERRKFMATKKKKTAKKKTAKRK